MVTWGYADHGGDSSSVQAELQEVGTIYSTARAFAAKLADGRVVTWGHAGYGGDSSSVQADLKHVDTISSINSAFAAGRACGNMGASRLWWRQQLCTLIRGKWTRSFELVMILLPSWWTGVW